MIDPIDETLAQMADSPYQVHQVLGWISSINSSAWWTRVHRCEVLPNEDAEGADQEPVPLKD